MSCMIKEDFGFKLTFLNDCPSVTASKHSMVEIVSNGTKIKANKDTSNLLDQLVSKRLLQVVHRSKIRFIPSEH